MTLALLSLVTLQRRPSARRPSWTAANMSSIRRTASPRTIAATWSRTVRTSRTRQSAVSKPHAYFNKLTYPTPFAPFTTLSVSSPFQCKFVESANICEHRLRVQHRLHLKRVLPAHTHTHTAPSSRAHHAASPSAARLNLQFISVQSGSEFRSVHVCVPTICLAKCLHFIIPILFMQILPNSHTHTHARTRTPTVRPHFVES